MGQVCGGARGFLDDAGSCPVTIAERPATVRPASGAVCGSGSIFIPFGAEWQVVGNSEEFLRGLADAAGGQVVSLAGLRMPSASPSYATSAGGEGEAPAEPIGRSMPRAPGGSIQDSAVSLVPYLIIAALLFFFAELLVAATAGTRGPRAL